MDFNWSDDQAAYRARVRTFIKENLPDNWEQLAHGPGSHASKPIFPKYFAANWLKPGC